jgi:hypothetical protein
MIYTREASLSALAPLALRDVLDAFGLADAASGAYEVDLIVRDAFSHAVLAAASTQFEVQRDVLQALRGTVSVQSTRIERGHANACVDTVTNAAASALPGVVITQNLVDLDSGDVLHRSELTRDFASAQQHVLTRSVATAALPSGGYACVLAATYEGRTQQLGAAGFEIIEPAIQIDATLTSEGRGRLLVLMDEVSGWPCTPLREIELWAAFRSRLPNDARIEVELLDAQGRRVDKESLALAQYRGTVNKQRGSGADMSIVGLSPDVLTVKVESSAGLGEGYRMVATATADSLPPIVVESNVMGTSCGWHAGIGARFGDFHCSGGRSRSGAHLPPPLARLPTLSEQRAFLEQLLQANGWSYTLVTDDEAFERELRSGAYAQYALFAEHEKLDEQVQKELREAVHRGEGLLDAGQHDRRHHGFDEALGIIPVGRQPHAHKVNLSAPWSPSGLASLHLGSESLRVRLDGAQKIANYPYVHGYDTAATTHSYGRGKSVYVGYDLLAEATHAGADSLHAQLLINALTQVAPEVISAHAGGVVPLQLTIQNRATATPGRALLSLPAGVTLIDAGEAQFANGTLSWPLQLEANAQQSFTVWVRLPEQVSPVTFTAYVQSGSEPSYIDQAQPTRTLAATARASLEDARQLAQTSIRFLLARFWLEKTQFWLALDRPEFALASLVHASTEVMRVSHPQAQQLRWHIDDAIWSLSREVE